MDRKSYLLFGVVMSAALLLIVGSVQAAPIVPNGDFETTPLGTWYSIPGWKTFTWDADNAGVLAEMYTSDIADNGKPSTMNNVAELFLRGEGRSVWMSTVATGFEVGRDYYVNYELNASQGDGAQSVVYDLQIYQPATMSDWGSLLPSLPTVVPVETKGSHTVLYNVVNSSTFTATGPDVHLKFTGVGTGGGTRSILLDNVSFHEVPEPSTLVLLILGLTGILVYAWRK